MVGERFGEMGGMGTGMCALARGTLRPGLTLSPQGLLSGITNKTGCVTITVTVTDDNCCTGTSQYKFCIGCQTITVVPPVTTTGTTGTPFCEAFTATGILGTPTFSSTGVLPIGIT